MKRLIVSADDFGLARSVNEGIVRAHREGIVTNLNLIPTGEAFEDAVRLAKEMSLAEAGAHLALTETSPVSVRNRVPTLVAKDGSFRRSHLPFVRDLLLRRIDPDHMYVELRTQVAMVARTGLRITSLSTHEHIHLIPAVLDIIIKLAREYDIPFVRCPLPERPVPPRTAAKAYKNALLRRLGVRVAHLLKEGGVRATDHFLGLLDSGRMDEARLCVHLAALEEGVTELVTHPGFLGPQVLDRYRFHLRSEEELFALTGKPARRALEASGAALSTFGEAAHP